MQMWHLLQSGCPVGKGGMAEWLMAAVLKTVDPKGFGGSNPSSSAKQTLKAMSKHLAF